MVDIFATILSFRAGLKFEIFLKIKQKGQSLIKEQKWPSSAAAMRKSGQV